MKITFLGGVEEVTGSKFLIEEKETRMLVDCGLFQGNKATRMRNWDSFPLEPSSINAIVLTHAHIDHTGYIPVLVKNGFRGTIYCSRATYELCAIMLLDSGLLQEEDAKKINKYKDTEHHVSPLYTMQDAQHALKYFKSVDYYEKIDLGAALYVTLIQSGHILGSSFVIISNDRATVTFSGDLGRFHQLIMKDPTHLSDTDFLVLESTYGNSLHDKDNPMNDLREIINRTVSQEGVVIIPAFAVGRTQTILYYLYQLKKQKLIPDIPIFVDSPMATSVTNLFCMFQDEHRLSSQLCKDVFDSVSYVRTAQESEHIRHLKNPAIIIAGSGMADGGRMTDHLKRFIADAKNSIVFVGFQAEGTMGRRLVDGAQEIKIYNKTYPVRARIKTINALSAHADYQEILTWLGYFNKAPKKVFITHGENHAAQSLKEKIEKQFGWSVVIPKYLESFDLDL